ncbi:MAG: helix-turn-helix domain-containing protein [Chloroflexota bacterium]
MNAEISSSGLDEWASMHLLTIAEIAKWARVHPKTVYRWIKEGKLPAIQLGKRTYRVPESMVASYLYQIGLETADHENDDVSGGGA